VSVVPARQVPAIGDNAYRVAPNAPGEYRFVDRDGPCAPPPAPGAVGHFDFACVRGRGYCGSVAIGCGHKPAGNKTWAWDGNVDAPTLSPSINCLSHGPNGEKYAGCGWHGWLRAGEWTEA